MAPQTYGNPKPFNPRPFHPYFDYALYEAAVAALTAPKPAETPKPKVSYEYVIRLDSGHGVARYNGLYVTYSDDQHGFVRGFTLEQATRFTTANAAAEALKKRNVANPGGAELFSLVPVKVTVTPATTSTKTVDEVVPGTTEYIIGLQRPGEKVIYVRVVQDSGHFLWTTPAQEAYGFSTANLAASVITRRQSLDKAYPNLFIEPRATPATTKPKTVTETIPGSTTVVLA